MRIFNSFINQWICRDGKNRTPTIANNISSVKGGVANGAAQNPKGVITSKSLFDYLKPKVQDEARLQNREQTPTVSYKMDIVIRAR